MALNRSFPGTQNRYNTQFLQSGKGVFSDIFNKAGDVLNDLSGVPFIGPILGATGSTYKTLAGGKFAEFGGYGTPAGAAKNPWVHYLRANKLKPHQITHEHRAAYHKSQGRDVVPPIKPRAPRKRTYGPEYKALNAEQKKARRLALAITAPIRRRRKAGPQAEKRPRSKSVPKTHTAPGRVESKRRQNPPAGVVEDLTLQPREERKLEARLVQVQDQLASIPLENKQEIKQLVNEEKDIVDTIMTFARDLPSGVVVPHDAHEEEQFVVHHQDPQVFEIEVPQEHPASEAGTIALGGFDVALPAVPPIPLNNILTPYYDPVEVEFKRELEAAPSYRQIAAPSFGQDEPLQLEYTPSESVPIEVDVPGTEEFAVELKRPTRKRKPTAPPIEATFGPQPVSLRKEYKVLPANAGQTKRPKYIPATIGQFFAGLPKASRDIIQNEIIRKQLGPKSLAKLYKAFDFVLSGLGYPDPRELTEGQVTELILFPVNERLKQQDVVLNGSGFPSGMYGANWGRQRGPTAPFHGTGGNMNLFSSLPSKVLASQYRA